MTRSRGREIICCCYCEGENFLHLSWKLKSHVHQFDMKIVIWEGKSRLQKESSRLEANEWERQVQRTEGGRQMFRWWRAGSRASRRSRIEAGAQRQASVEAPHSTRRWSDRSSRGRRPSRAPSSQCAPDRSCTAHIHTTNQPTAFIRSLLKIALSLCKTKMIVNSMQRAGVPDSHFCRLGSTAHRTWTSMLQSMRDMFL